MQPRIIIRFVLMAIVIITLVIIGLRYSKGDVDKISNTLKEPKYTTNKWERNLNLKNRGPFGLYWLEQLMLEHPKFEEFNLIHDAKYLDSIEAVNGSVFYYIGESMQLTDEEIHRLLFSVEKGNEWFVSTHQTAAYLLDLLANYPRITYHFQRDAQMVWDKDTFNLNFIDNLDTLPAKWAVLHPSLINDAEILVQLNNKATLLRFPYGEGAVYMDLNTKSYLNYQLKQKDGLAYLMKLADTFKGNKIQWLAFADEPDDYYPDEDNSEQESYLAIILAFEGFRWAFSLLILLVISYLLLHTKRRSPIATMEKIPEKGASFATTIAGFYYKNDQPYYMLLLMKKNLASNISHFFYIDISKDLDETAIKQLSAKSNYPLKDLKELLQLANRTSLIDYPFLEKLNDKIRDFYWTSGIWNEHKKALEAQQWQTYYLQKPITWLAILIGLLSMLAGLFPAFENNGYFGNFQVGAGIVSLAYSVFLVFFIYKTPLRKVITFAFGVVGILGGLILLFSMRVSANDFGAIQILIGFLLLLFGLYKFAVPDVSYTAQKIKLYRLFKKVIVIDKSAIIAAVMDQNSLRIQTKSSTHKIPLPALSIKEREQLIQLLYKPNQNLKNG